MAGPDRSHRAAGERTPFLLRRVAPLVLVVVAVVGALAIYDGLSDDTGNAGISGTYDQVRDDESWLAYLPADGTVPGLSVAGLTSVTTSGPVSRRIDFRLPGVPDGDVSLCFVSFEGDLVVACPDAKLLGQVDRAVGLPYVGLVGPIGALDWLTVYETPTPALAELDYLKG